MQPEQSYKFKIPIFHWLFFLFLVVGVSDLAVQKQIFRIETVDSSSQELSRNSPTTSPFTLSSKVFISKSLNLSFQIFKYLSNNLDNRIGTIFSRYSLQAFTLPQNKILHFRNRNLTSQSPEDTFTFIS